ncbi:type IV pilin N-terminal domain-containing protein [Natrialbaceae archaeon AArc-T1-2]|uniref:type IV pilin N-terminal domain-containing protein n=1 Tax=Natrialbaceae archaeon AArc-T1-2 TaxID=3053904 RepID=UPI00255B3086|nr:type IV pilin N-terminal domain-containing protein [Natrialbaceae archaeon AArc-T1-2]WIV65796.1 type IV pilin N-terminal domain-containing protein [Natrialbaceae archaeon AArc-T1-2]
MSPSDIGITDRNRSVSPAVGVVLLVAITVVIAGVVAASVGAWSLPSPGPNAAFSLAVETDGTVTIEHVAGDPVDVEELTVTVEVDGEPLAHQPPVPFVGATGFENAPSGPFNAATESQWTTGERATFVVASTNEPTIEAGDEVTVRLAVDGQTVATLEATAT